MPERIDRMLAEAAREVDFPPTPDLAGAVTGRLREPAAPPARGRARPVRRTLALAALTLLLAAATVLAASPGARDAVLELLGIRGATVETVPRLPDVPPRGTDAGDRVGLAEARRRAGFEIRVPSDERALDVRFSNRAPGGVVSFTTRELAVTQLRARVPRELLGKLVTEGTRVERLGVGGDPALWLVGRPHVVFLRDARGRIIEESLRRAGNVLLLEQDGVVIRIEGARTRADAVAVARSLG